MSFTCLQICWILIQSDLKNLIIRLIKSYVNFSIGKVYIDKVNLWPLEMGTQYRINFNKISFCSDWLFFFFKWTRFCPESQEYNFYIMTFSSHLPSSILILPSVKIFFLLLHRLTVVWRWWHNKIVLFLIKESAD